jgi:hypothetical protein
MASPAPPLSVATESRGRTRFARVEAPVGGADVDPCAQRLAFLRWHFRGSHPASRGCRCGDDQDARDDGDGGGDAVCWFSPAAVASADRIKP